MVQNPEKAAFPSLAFKIAAWFWTKNAFIILSKEKALRGSLNVLVDGTFHNFTLLTHSLTNNLQKLIDRANFNDLVLAELDRPAMKRGSGVICEIPGAGAGVAVPVCMDGFKRPYCGCEGLEDRRSCPYGMNGGTCRSSSIIKCCQEKNKKSMDLVSCFILANT